MTASIKNGKLIIEIPAETVNPRPSSSGKSRIVASTNGNATTAVIVDGKPVIVGLNAYIKN
jgi:hypothetical protein